MASESQHIDCANRTQKTIAHLLVDRDSHSPWIAVTAFYKALHVVEAVFSRNPSIGHASNHEERERLLVEYRKYEKIYRHYSILKRASMNARYLSGCTVFDDYLKPNEVVDKLLKHELHQLEQAGRKFLSPSVALESILGISGI